MAPDFSAPPAWLTSWMARHDILLWGIADLRSFSTPSDDNNRQYPSAISMAMAMDPDIMVTIQEGPNQDYADEYTRVNSFINRISVEAADEIGRRGYRALPLAASERTDEVHVQGDFPHKTAATRAGLGWIGRHCQLITRPFGSWVRLGTVFTDMFLPYGSPQDRGYCGRCTRCVDACPADALTGKAWYPGIPRHEILDVHACDRWKKTHYRQYHDGHNCGICSAVCPYGLKVLKRRRDRG